MTTASDVWSGLATRIERTRRRGIKPRTRPIHGVVLHTTGSGIVVKALKKGEPPLDYAARWYARPDAAGSNYLVGAFAEDGYDGSDDAVIGTVPENLVSWHTSLPPSSDRFRLYRQGRDVWPAHRMEGGRPVRHGHAPLPDHADWLLRWPDLDSPIDLNPAPSLGVNANFLGIDLLAPEPGVGHSELQARWAAALVRDVFERHAIPLARERVVRHSDMDPLSRSTRRGGWDPPIGVFDKICELLGIECFPAGDLGCQPIYYGAFCSPRSPLG